MVDRPIIKYKYNNQIIEVEPISEDPEDYIRRTAIIYGPSGSGKSAIIKYLLHIVKNAFEAVFVISPTASGTNDFKGVVPDGAIYEDTKNVIPFLKGLKHRQEMMKNCVGQASNFDNLHKIFDLYSRDKHTEDEINKIFRNALNKLENSNKPMDIKLRKKGEIKNDRVLTLTKFYKKFIVENREMILNTPNLPSDIQMIVKYCNVNPHVLLIFDDCASELKEWSSNANKEYEKGENVMKAFLFNNRWLYLSVWISIQDDAQIPPQLRKNAQINIWTTPGIANTVLKRSTSSLFEKHETDLMLHIGAELMKQQEGIRNYKKLCYVRAIDKPCNPYRYCLADDPRITPPVRVGSNLFWKLCRLAIETNTLKSSENNEFFQDFVDDEKNY